MNYSIRDNLIYSIDFTNIHKKTVKIEQNGKIQEISSNQDLESLKKISKDYKDGKITEAEFEKRKGEILK